MDNLKSIPTMDGQHLEKKEEIKYKRITCNCCHGMGLKERPNGDTFDCPIRQCESGFIKVKAD